jgi:Transglutaminase-like superfamily
MDHAPFTTRPFTIRRVLCEAGAAIAKGAAVSADVAFYTSPGPMTDLSGIDSALFASLSDPVAITAAVHGVVLHRFWVDEYGVEVPPEREGEVQIRSAAAMVRRVIEMDSRPLAERREPPSRFLGNCRHISVLTVALLRRIGIPSRARCGFAGYFEPGRWVDHWVVEYRDSGRWVTLDAQIDEKQRAATGLAPDPADLPPGYFLPAGEGWRRCRAGLEKGDSFGILDMWGQWFIKGNIARDLAALNKVEMLPWDGWGALCVGEDDAAGGDRYVDEVAALTLRDDLAAIRHRYETDDGLRVPPRVMSYATPMGPLETDVEELV